MVRNGHLNAIQQTETIFVSGSRSIKTLPELAREQFNQHINNGSHFVLGDAPGFDTIAQQYFAALNYTNVTVYHIGEAARNNFGFPTHRVAGHRQADKDIAMAKVADRGLAVWDGKSPGTKQNIARLPTDVIIPSVPVSSRGQQARADVLAQSTSEDVRALYNVPEGLTRGQHTTALHQHDPFVRDEFERGATVSDSVLSIPRDPDSRSIDSDNVKIGTESHAIAFVSGFISDSNLAREKGERLYHLAEQACGQWTTTNGRWQTFTAVYDLVRKDENGNYRTNDEKALVIDQVLDSIAGWAEHLPTPAVEPSAEEIYRYTLELAAENQQQIETQERDEPDITAVSSTDPRLLYVHELNSNSRGLATIGELTNFTLEDTEPEISLDETEVYGNVFENAVLDAADLVTADHLGAEIPTAGGGPALDATFDRINLDALPPTIPNSLSEQTQSFLLDSLIPTIDAQIDRGANKQELLSIIYKENRVNESERFNEKIEHAFGVNDEQSARAPISRQDRLNALTSLRLLLAGEYKRETRGFSREAIEWAKGNYRLNPDALRAAGKLKVLDNGRVSEYQSLVRDQTNARTEWVKTHQGQQAPYRAQIERINELESAGHQVNNRISALNPSNDELLRSLRCAQGNLVAARDQTQARLNDFAQADARVCELKLEAVRYADTVRASDEFAEAKSHFLHNENERSIDQRQEAVRGNSARFDYLSESSHGSNSGLGQLKEEQQAESQAERSQLAGLLIDPRIEAEQSALTAEIKDHQSYFTQLAGREISSPTEAQIALQPRLPNLDSVIAFAGNSIHRLDATSQTAPEPALTQAPIYVSLTSNEQLRIPVATLPEYDALTNAVRDCRLQTDTWRTLHSPMPLTGRDEERDAVAMFVADYIDFRQSDHATAQLNENRVFREYAQRLNDTRTTDELITTAVAISKENFNNYQQQEAHRLNPETVLAPATPPLSLKDMRQLFLAAAPVGATKSATAEMRAVLVSTVFGQEKTNRVHLLANGQLKPSPALAKLLQNLDSRTTTAAVDHFYASLRNPEPTRANAFNLYEAHKSLPQFEKDYLHQYALKEKYESLKEQPNRTNVQTQQPQINERPQEPSIAATAKATASYSAYYGQADWREAALCASSLAQQEGLTRVDLDRNTVAPEVSDLEARAINYAVHNFDQTRQAQVVQHLRSSEDRHVQTLGDMLALASEAHHAGSREVTTGAINLPSEYPLSVDSAQKVVSFALEPNQQSLHPQDLAAARQLAQHETWNQHQQSLISDPALLVDAPVQFLNEARELHQLVRSAAELQDRARIAFAVRDAHFNSCLHKVTIAVQSSQRASKDQKYPSEATIKDIVNLVLHPKQPDRNGVSKSNAQQLAIARGVISQSDIQKASELSQYANSARNDYLQTFPKLDNARSAVQNSQTQLAERVVASYEEAARETTSASSRYASVKEQVERTLIGEQLGQVFNSNVELTVENTSARDLLPPDVLAQTAAAAREEAWQSLEPQEIRDDRAGTTVDERTLNAAYHVMDQVDNARTVESGLAEASQIEATFQQIDSAIERLDITRAEVRMEQQLTPYEQIAQPVAERVNDYLKATSKEEGLKAILEPLRHEGHVDKIALAIMQTAQECNVQLGHSPDGVAQVHQVAGTLFDALRDGMERANAHLIQGMQLTAELHRSELLSNQQQLQRDPHSPMNGQHGMETLQTLEKSANAKPTSDRLLDLSKGDLLNPFMEYDDASRTSELTQSQSLNNSGSQATALTQNPAQEEASHVLDLVL